MAVRDSFVDVNDGDQLNDGYFNGIGRDIGLLGEVRMFAITISGAHSVATLQGKGWAVCNGTTAASQGISSADITAATPNLVDRFIRGDASASGTTGGSATHIHKWYVDGENQALSYQSNGSSTVQFCTLTGNHHTAGSVSEFNPVDNGSEKYTDSQSSLSPYYELVFMMKVKQNA